MSLDVYLYDGNSHSKADSAEIWIREGGRNIQLSRTEWNERYPDREPIAINQKDDDEEEATFHANITHNLGRMASEAGIYKYLWRPDENEIERAHQLIEPLQEGLTRLNADPHHFKTFNPENGWGDYKGLVEFVSEYLSACIESPDAEVRVCR